PARLPVAAAPTSPSAIPPAASVVARGGRAPPSGCPSVDPDFGEGVVALHQRGSNFDREFFLDAELEAQPPTASGGIGLGDDVLNAGFFRRDDAANGFRVDRLQPLADE